MLWIWMTKEEMILDVQIAVVFSATLQNEASVGIVRKGLAAHCKPIGKVHGKHAVPYWQYTRFSLSLSHIHIYTHILSVYVYIYIYTYTFCVYIMQI